MDFASSSSWDFSGNTSWDLSGKHAVTLIFGNDSEVTNLEYNEFQVINFASKNALVGLTYRKQNLDATNLETVEGYDEFTDNEA